MMQATGTDAAAWDAALHREHGDLLQSWRWGEFKQRHGWDVIRVHIGSLDEYAMAQIIFRQGGPFSIAYIPRGPVFTKGLTDDAGFWDAVDEACEEHRAVNLVVEPDHALPSGWTQQEKAFYRGPQWFQTSQTVKVPLAGDDELLAQMRKDTRYNINYARRHGVTVERVPAEPAEMLTFYKLLRETSERGSFGIHTPAYYNDFMRIFRDDAMLFLAYADGKVTAGLIAARCGSEGRSMYAGTSSDHRVRGDAALLRFEAMRWTRDEGGSRYDLGGIVPVPNAPGSSSSLAGVNKFKIGFGGEIVAYPQTLERRYRPALAWVVRHINPKFREAPPATEAHDV